MVFAPSRVRRRATEVLGRLGVTDPGGPTLDALERIDQAVTELHQQVDRAAMDRVRFGSALAAMDEPVVLADQSGQVVLRSRGAASLADARHGDALIEGAVQDLIAESLGGSDGDRTLELFGPPRRTLVLRSSVLLDQAAGAESEVIGVMVTVEDVTQRQRSEAGRRDLVANISHELKTPIGALGVLSEALEGETDPETVQRLSSRIQAEAFRLAATVDDLLQLSEVEEGGGWEPEPVDLANVVSEAIERVASTADRLEVGVTVEAPLGSGRAVVAGQHRQLVSAVANLLENAVKYSDPGGEVVIRLIPHADRVALEVIDRGIGIPGSDLARVFERFYRVDRARSRDTGGTGLGLAIVRHIAHSHGGEVTVESREGQGSTFTLTVPSAVGLADRPTMGHES